jgi:hypothetical protein
MGIRLLENIVKSEIVDKLDNRLKITYASLWSNGQQTIRVCSKKWLDLYGYLIDESNTQISILFETDDSITIQISQEKAFKKGDTLFIKKPLLFAGTLYNTTEEWHKFSNDQRVKLPFIWLVTPTNEVFNGRDNDVERESPIHVVFVHYSDWLNSDNKKRLNDSIQPLSDLASAFIDAIDGNRTAFSERDTFRLKKFPKFGTETNSGVKDSVIAPSLAGVDLTVQLKIYKESCNC